MQLSHLYADVSGDVGVIHHSDSVQVVCLNLHNTISGPKDETDFAFVKVAPLDAVRQRGNGGRSRVLDSVVLEVAGDDHLPTQQGAQGLLLRDAHAQPAVLIWGNESHPHFLTSVGERTSTHLIAQLLSLSLPNWGEKKQI